MRSTIKDTFKADVIESKKIVMLDVWAPWCAPCRGMEPILQALQEETKVWVEIIKLDASVEMDQVQELGVSALPTFLVYKDGQIVDSTVGATSKANLLNMLTSAK
jgi:thioredoxin 1